jgi:hypothetical protein
MPYLFVILFIGSLLLLITALIKPSLFANKGKSPSRKNVLLAFGSLTLLFFFLTGITSNTGNSQQVSTQKPPSVNQKDSRYQKFDYKDAGNVENHYLVYQDSDISEDTLIKFASDYKGKQCMKPCNISIFDTTQAAESDKEFRNLSTPEKQDTWKKRNYVYVADHFPGMMTFDSEGYLFYYPYKDSYYNELK